jgi:hypothetical protein
MSVWNITLCDVVEIYGCFKVYWCHHVQGERMHLIVTAVRTSSCAWKVLMAHTLLFGSMGAGPLVLQPVL